MYVVPGYPITFSFIASLPLAQDALEYAQAAHRGQRRDSDDAPFILHPLEVAALLHNTGHREALVAAAMLHDTIEDTSAQPAELAERFGGDVAALVEAMSEDPRIDDYDERKAALREQIAAFGSDAIAIDAADKVAKVRELRAQTGAEPSLLAGEHAPAHRRLEHYVASLRMLERSEPEHPLVRQLRFELEALRALPPRFDAISPEDVRAEAL
jgi:(p)ppGpp synthase/HD superfamily hydrolase